MIARLGLIGLLLVLPAMARAAEVTFTLAVDYPLLQAAMQREIGLGNGPTVLWGSTDGCRSLVLRDLTLGPDDDRVRIGAGGQGQVGFDVASFCLFPLTWDGSLVARGRPSVGEDWQLRLIDVDSQLLDRDGRSTFVARRLWSFVGDRVEEPLADFRFDLAPPATEVRALLQASAPPANAGPVIAALDSLRPVETTVAGDAVLVRVVMDVPDTAPTPTAPEPALTPEERAAWESALDRWDAFLVFVVKDLGLLGREPVRDALFDLLMRSRNSLVDVLAAGPMPGEDPVRRLFLDAWSELRPVVRQAALAGELGEHALRYVAFLAAGDALAALDAAAPALGLELSADGLRRLARVLEPDHAGDPLALSDAPDPVLRDLFGFHEPETTPPAAAEPPPPSPTTWWWWPLATAHAAEGPPPTDLPGVGRALDRWVPEQQDMVRYRDLVSQLLDLIAVREGTRGAVGASWQTLYRQLVRTTAWQESCWRQFVEENGAVTYLISGTGDVGLMQVNRRVWRGFFDVQKLEWDIVYNAGAGAEILAQLLTRYGVREASQAGGHAARASYAAYNGGPSAHRRYRSGKARKIDRGVDRAFWKKFQFTAAGQELDHVLCTPFVPTAEDDDEG
ncbi:MAG TPA: transglycosylase SLT domain-containing protein [Candidatus Binatia bacterium]|nr:transglycosylase SLT domain-containing protein [Candidatus Binatia bacterium]